MNGTYNEFKKHCEEKLKAYLSNRQLSSRQAFLTHNRFLEEMKLLKIYIDKYPESVCALWLAAFLGELKKQAGVNIRNQMIQCPFIMYLLNLASYNVLDEGFLEQDYLYTKSMPSFHEYWVSDDFREKAAIPIVKYCEAYGYQVLWIGDNENKNYPKDYLEITNSAFILTKDFSVLNCPPYHLSTLKNGIHNLSIEGFYQLERTGVINDNLYILHKSHKENIYVSASTYTRDDLLFELLHLGICKERAYYWTELIRRGVLSRMIKSKKISYNDYQELEVIVGSKRLHSLCQIEYLPSKWTVLEDYFYHKRSKK